VPLRLVSTLLVLVVVFVPAAPAEAKRLKRLDTLAAASNQRFGGIPMWRSGLRPVVPCTGTRRLARTWVLAGRSFGIRPSIIAAISEVESAHGCTMGPSSAGALGWTQFMPATWRAWGMDADGDGKASPYDSVDAMYSTARYLRANGAPRRMRKALYAYNHAGWYVRLVLRRARAYR
jgi:hypothetical protein